MCVCSYRYMCSIVCMLNTHGTILGKKSGGWTMPVLSQRFLITGQKEHDVGERK